MPSFLIVNDDGAESPMLRPLAERLAELGPVRVAVPLQENNWKGKAITRHGKVRVHALAGLPGPAFAVEGTPSDCANLGIHQLFGERPDWVVAGINIGVNAGMNFVINSGTVGAAIEAALTAVPAVAFSAYLTPELYGQWMERRRLEGPEAERTIAATTERAARMLWKLGASGLPPGASLLNVNFPRRLAPDTPARWVGVLDNRYGSLFSPDGDGYIFTHRGVDSWRAPEEGDRVVVERGEISVTALSLRGLSLPVRDPIDL